MSELSDWRVLIVDDEPDNLGVLELIMDFHKINVKTAGSGPACLQMMEQEAPTLLLVDVQMPGMSGTELMDKIRERDEWNHIPIVAVTAHAMRGDDERMLASGFDGYIAKPINAMTFISELQSILEAKVGAT
jgi:CheY-like chemotaxis protein